MKGEKLFHVSEEPNIPFFEPRPSPSRFEGLHEDVVFAIGENLLHNYLLPRDCPRVCFYKGPNTSAKDLENFFAHTRADYIMAVENAWLEKIASTTIYCYELPTETFTSLDECAGYYISLQRVAPTSLKVMPYIMSELLARNIELRFMPSLWPLADAVVQSTLQFSLIRMRNAAKKEY
jgi:hypothetical protein